MAAVLLTACEKAVLDEKQGNVTLTFSVTQSDMVTRGTVAIGDYFQKLNIQLFDADGSKVFDKVRTQLATDDDFGTISCQLEPGTYTIVAVGHSSIKSATIKSPHMVQFTASDGEKLTDTFCSCGQIYVGDTPEQHNLVMNRVTAMVQFRLTDTSVPESFSKMVITYTGGSANFNPSSFDGTTKSNQSEYRTRSSVYQVYTFPYMANSGTLKMTLTAYASDGSPIRTRTFDSVPVTRNRITTYTGQFFDGTEGTFTQTAFGFSVNGDWEGENNFTF